MKKIENLLTGTGIVSSLSVCIWWNTSCKAFSQETIEIHLGSTYLFFRRDTSKCGHHVMEDETQPRWSDQKLTKCVHLIDLNSSPVLFSVWLFLISLRISYEIECCSYTILAVYFTIFLCKKTFVLGEVLLFSFSFSSCYFKIGRIINRFSSDTVSLQVWRIDSLKWIFPLCHGVL